MATTLHAYAGKPCPYCGRKMALPPDALNIGWTPSRDHIVPKSAGGTRAQKNIVVVCRRCNNERADRTLEVWAIHLEAAGDHRLERVRDFIEWREPLGENLPVTVPVISKKPRNHRELLQHLFEVHQHGIEPKVKIRYESAGASIENREPARHHDLDDAGRPADPAE